MVIQIATDLQTAVQDATPVKTSHLQENWFVGDLVKRGNEYYIEVYNNVEYAEPVKVDIELQMADLWKEHI